VNERFMSDECLPIGIFTTDEHLVVRAWDERLTDVTGITADRARNRHLTELIPDLGSRGILATFENVLARGTVEVLSPALHHYLIACAPSREIADFVCMRQHVTIGPLRADGRIVGLVVTLEDVTERVIKERQIAAHLADSTRQADPDLSYAALAARQISSLTRLMAQDDWRVRRATVTTLAEHGDAIVDSLVRALRDQHQNLAVLSSALDLLAMSDVDVVGPLIGFLDAPDANLRIQAALILGDRRSHRAIPPLIAHLSDHDVNVQFHVIEALGRLHAKEACDALVEIAERRDFFLAFPALQALRNAGNPSIAPRLVPLLDDELLCASVIDVLGELGDEDVAMPLVDLLNESDAPADVIADALAGLYDRYDRGYAAGEHIAGLVRRGITARGTHRILDAVQRVDSDRLPNLARVLGWLEGEAAQRALTRLLGHEAVRSQIVEALVRHGAGVVTLLIEQLRVEDLETRQAAALALGRIGDRRATPGLIDALRDPELAVPAAGALARIGDRAAFEGLMAMLGEREPATRQSVIAALNSIGHPDMAARIAKRLEDPDRLVRESALRIAGYFGYPECLDHVLRCCHDPAESVRRAAVEGLAFFDDPLVVPALVKALEQSSSSVRAGAAGALARTEGGVAVEALTRTLGDPDPWVRYTALRSLGSIGDSSVASAVLTTLRTDPAPYVRLAAVDVLGRLRPAEAWEVLEPLTRSSDSDIGGAAIRALGHLDRSEVMPALEGFLRAPDSWQREAAVAAATLRSDTRVAQVLQWVAAVDDDGEVVGAAIEGLAKIARRPDYLGTEAVFALMALTAEPLRREAAIKALSELPTRRIGDVARGLDDSSPDVRCASVEALGRMQHPNASRALESALDDAHPAVRLAAIRALKNLGTREPLRKLMTLTRTDPEAEVRRAAMFAASRSDEGVPDLPSSR
jgi:HEAT repeat protein